MEKSYTSAMSEEETNAIPENDHGIKTDTESSVDLDTEEEAKAHFQIVKERLLNIRNWRNISIGSPTDFRLTDRDGTEVHRPAQEGDYFNIDIPGPGSDSGEGLDWVQIIEIEHKAEANSEHLAIKVQPRPHPAKVEKNVSHFFDEEASSTFMVRREGLKVSASVHGRNEQPNTETENITDKIRNAVVAVGAMLGFSKAQWKSLVEGLVKK